MNQQKEAPFTRRALKRVSEANSEEYEFSIVTYNILADYWILQNSWKEDSYSYCPKEYMIRTKGRASHRHILLMAELRWLDSDIICLQEVDTSYFREILKGDLSELGYEGLFAEKCMGIPEGEALFFKKNKFHLQETKTVHLNDMAECTFKQAEIPQFWEVVLLATLRHKLSNSLLVLCVTHIRWGNLQETVSQACQITMVTKALYDMVSTLQESQGNRVAYILCGDFNIEPQFPAYKLLAEGKLTDKEINTLKGCDYIRWGSDTYMEKALQLSPDQVALLHRTEAKINNPLVDLQSAYKNIMGAEPRCTNHEGPECLWTLDYIWFDSRSLEVTAALETVSPSAIEPYTGLPNEYFPSDHLSLKAYFKFASSREKQE